MRVFVVFAAISLLISACQSTKSDGGTQPTGNKNFIKLEKELEEKNKSDPHSLNQLGVVKFYLKKYDEAAKFHLRALKLYDHSSSREFPDVSATLYFLALTKAEQGKLQEAVPLFERNLTIVEKVYNSTHPCLVGFLTPLAESLRELGKSAQADILEKRAKSIQGQCGNPFQG